MPSLLSLGTLIDTTFAHYKKHLAALLGVTLWLLVAALPSGLGILLSKNTMDLDAATWFSFGFQLFGGIISAFTALHIAVALLLGLRTQSQGKEIDPRTVLKQAFSFDLAYLWTIFLKTVLTTILPLIPLFFFIGGFIFAFQTENTLFINIMGVLTFIALLGALGGAVKFSLLYTFSPYATVLDGMRGMASLRASATLVRGRWWATFLRVILPKILYTLIFVIFLAVSLWLTSLVGVALTQESFLFAKTIALVNFFVSTLANALLLPALLLNDFYVYEDLRKNS